MNMRSAFHRALLLAIGLAWLAGCTWHPDSWPVPSDQPRSAQPPSAAPTSATVIVVSGRVFTEPFESQNPTSIRVELDPTFVFPNQHPTQPQVDAEYALVLLDASGAELIRHPFTPRSVIPSGCCYFDERIPFPGTAAELRVEYRSRPIASFRPGSSAPTVRVLSPNGGEVLSDYPFTVTWEASDVDGDEMVFLVEYIGPGGETQRLDLADNRHDRPGIPVGSRTSTYQLEVWPDTMFLAWGSVVHFRVWATDGIHTSYDVSDGPVSVADHRPAAIIVEPQEHATIALGQGLSARVFQNTPSDEPGVAFDSLDPNQVTWTSDQDGLVGTGTENELFLKTVGIHTISATVTDDTGRMASDQVRVEVVSSFELLPVTLQAGWRYVNLNSDDTMGMVNLYSWPRSEISLPWQAVSAAPWLRLSPSSGTTPTDMIVSYDPELPPGYYLTTIILTSPALQDQVIAIDVSVSVELRLSSAP